MRDLVFSESVSNHNDVEGDSSLQSRGAGVVVADNLTEGSIRMLEQCEYVPAAANSSSSCSDVPAPVQDSRINRTLSAIQEDPDMEEDDLS